MVVHATDRSDTPTATTYSDGITHWLAWLSQLLADRLWIGLVTFEAESQSPPIVQGFPLNHKAPAAALLVARKSWQSGRTVSVRLSQSVQQESGSKPSVAPKPILSLFAVPLPGEVDRVLLLHGPDQTGEQQALSQKLCRWASTWIDRSERPTNTTQTGTLAASEQLDPSAEFSRENVGDILSDAVLRSAQHYATPESVALAIVNTMKRLSGCQRVSLAVARGLASPLNLMAISDQSRIDSRKTLPSRLVAAMQERLEFGVPDDLTAQNPDSLDSTLPAHAVLFQQHGECPALCVVYPPTPDATEPLTAVGKPIVSRVVVLLERPKQQTFTDAQHQAISSLLAPCLSLLARMLDEQSSSWQKFRNQLQFKFGKQQLLNLTSRQYLMSIAGLLFVASFIIPVQHRISARAAIEAKDLQVLVAPHAGFIATSHVRAGDLVKKNEVLATLDTQDLRLMLNKWESEAAKNVQAMDLALATRDRVALGRLRADAARISAERTLVEHQLNRAELRSPFDGVVLTGDLSQRLGSSVAQGDTLFTIAASNEYRLVLDIKEQDVGLVESGQAVSVRMSALPNRTWQASVEAVLPVATNTREANVFRVPAQLVQRSDALLPGMEGIAKLPAGIHSIAWVYTRNLREKLKLLLWRMGVIH